MVRCIGFVLLLAGVVGFLATLLLAVAFAVLWGRVGLALLVCGGLIGLGAALRERDEGEEAKCEWRMANSREGGP